MIDHPKNYNVYNTTTSKNSVENEPKHSDDKAEFGLKNVILLDASEK
jgi:hypothetical protein